MPFFCIYNRHSACTFGGHHDELTIMLRGSDTLALKSEKLLDPAAKFNITLLRIIIENIYVL